MHDVVQPWDILGDYSPCVTSVNNVGCNAEPLVLVDTAPSVTNTLHSLSTTIQTLLKKPHPTHLKDEAITEILNQIHREITVLSKFLSNLTHALSFVSPTLFKESYESSDINLIDAESDMDWEPQSRTLGNSVPIPLMAATLATEDHPQDDRAQHSGAHSSNIQLTNSNNGESDDHPKRGTHPKKRRQTRNDASPRSQIANVEQMTERELI